MSIPNFFIVGGRKCGTTSLYALLKSHPQIFMPRRKEPHYFGSDVHARSSFTKDDYLNLFAGAAGHKAVGEASTGYLYSKRAAAEIRDFNPEARIIVMLRNPIDAIHSLHSEYVFEGVEHIDDFEAALEAEERRKREPYYPPPAVAMEFLYYREWVRYADQLKRYLDVFGREKIHVILMDDFKAGAGAVLRDTLSFLEVATDFRTDERIRNPNKLIRFRSLQKFMLNPQKTVPRLARTLTRNLLIRGLVRLNTKYGPRPAMNPALRNRLTAEFRPEIERLGSLLNRDLSGWFRPAEAVPELLTPRVTQR